MHLLMVAGPPAQSLISIIVVLIIVGVCLWLVNQYVPMAQPIKTILNVVVAIVIILWLTRIFGLI